MQAMRGAVNCVEIICFLIYFVELICFQHEFIHIVLHVLTVIIYIILLSLFLIESFARVAARKPCLLYINRTTRSIILSDKPSIETSIQASAA